MNFLKLASLLAFLVLGFLTSGHLEAGAAPDEYPLKPARIVVGFSAGGPSDILARLVAQRLGDMLGHRFLTDNRPGASGMIGAELVAKAPADGYTLLMVPATHSVNPSLYQKMPFDTLRAFTAVGLVAEGPFVLVVHPSLPVRSVKELIALARARQGQLNYASAGVGGLPHLAGELFKSMTGVQMTHIPYKGAAPATVELVGGHVPIMFNNMLSAVPHIKNGRLRPLAVTTHRRTGVLPEVPTIAESGVEGYDVSGWYGLLAPAGLPPAVLNRLNSALNRVVLQPEVVRQLADEGIDAVTSTPEEFTARISREIAKWAVVVKASGATAN